MRIRDIGISLSVPAGPRRLQRLEEALGFVFDAGYRLVELNPSPFAVIVDGAVRGQQLAELAAVLGNFQMRYSVHGLNRLNLAYDPRHDLSVRILRCQLQVCQALGAGVLVYHSGLQALDQLRYGLFRQPLTDAQLAAGAQQEVEAFRALGPIAADAGVVIAMENGDSHLWEHNLLARHGLPRDALLRHHARLRIEPIVAQLAAIDHPNVGLCLDVAHLHIAAGDLGFDYLASVEAAAPWTVHLHANDNFGRLDWGFDSEPDRWAYGEADIHLPPGWGSIPYTEVFARLPGFAGDLILEIKAGFADFFAESLQTMRQLTAASPG